MNHQRLHTLLSRFRDLSILVVGDFFLDKYLIIDRSLSETSLETSLEAYQIIERRCSPGAAGTVTSNLRGLGVGTVHALSVIGEDGEGHDLKHGLMATQVQTDGLIEVPDRFTPTYTKPIVREATGPARELNRLDIKNRTPMPAAVEARIIESLRTIVPCVHGVIIADQVQGPNQGVITDRVRETIAALAVEHPDTIFFADSRVRIECFRNIIIKPNRHEAARAVRPDWDGPVDRAFAEACGRALCAQTRRPVYVTLSEDGMLLITDQGVDHLPGIPVDGEIDPVGAGDSTTAGIVSALCAGATHQEAGLIGNLVASITVQQVGTTGTASPEQVLQRFRERFETG